MSSDDDGFEHKLSLMKNVYIAQLYYICPRYTRVGMEENIEQANLFENSCTRQAKTFEKKTRPGLTGGRYLN